MKPSWDRARAIADAVLYEGYLLYPYRATSSKNQSRWQFGVVGPPGACDAGIGESDSLTAQFLVDGDSELTLVVRFLQLQHRRAERDIGDGTFEPVDKVTSGLQSWVTWDEAVERELSFGPFGLTDLVQPRTLSIEVGEGSETEAVDGGRLIRTRSAIRADLTVAVEHEAADLHRVSTAVRNVGEAAADKDEAIATSLIGTHIIAEVVGGEFISLLDPPDSARATVSHLVQHRCFPVLAGRPGEHDLLLISPIILYDHPEIAEQSEGALYDSTEIDEILTLRVMTMTDEEKAQARATDPLAAAIIDRCDSMSPEAMQQLHGILRNPHASGYDDPRLDALDGQMRSAGLIPEIPDGVDWWDPVADTAVRPDVDAVLVNGVRVSAGSRVRLRPSRRADAQDIFFAGKSARVISVHEDVDGQQYVGVIVEDDPDVEMPDSYGRYLYFAPDEVEPIDAQVVSPERSS
ncbi:hypothetical protein ACIA48_06215 [Mycobacterium sp. NPDC051804]|uniref:hypothetical protein n=1 Tax=Mycobacterium sp. NPDC051804 TaxID=3364295 RepID=UPI0037B44BFF